MAHEQRLNGRASRVHGRESAKDHGGARKAWCIQGNAEEIVNPCQARRRPMYGVICRRKSVQILIPGWRARKDELDQNPNNVQIPKAFREDGDRPRRCEHEHDGRTHRRCPKVHDAIRKPCHDVQKGVLVRGQDVAQVCAIKDVFERW